MKVSVAHEGIIVIVLISPSVVVAVSGINFLRVRYQYQHLHEGGESTAELSPSKSVRGASVAAGHTRHKMLSGRIICARRDRMHTEYDVSA